METRSTYLGTQSDFHTHAHDLPPQMGGCYEAGGEEQARCRELVDQGPFARVPDADFTAPETARDVALARMIKHHETVVAVNPHTAKAELDEALRSALTRMMTGTAVEPPGGTGAALRYVRDRINVPRDMPLHSARLLRQALEDTAALAGGENTPPAPLPVRHRRDQNPIPFGPPRPAH